MKIITPLSLILFFLASCSSEPEFTTTDYITDLNPGIFISDELNLYADRSGNPLNGELHLFFDDGTPQAELLFENGMVSEGRVWNEDGTLHQSYSFEDGLFKKTVHMEDGKPRLEMYFGKHLEDRIIFNVWFENGKPFIQNSPTLSRMWHENGQLALESTLVDGKMHGEAFAWHENGEIAARNHFKDDEMHGLFRNWDEEGNLIRKRVYEMGTLVSEDM
jgi:antitoxin component YwqK of YwqJK toxin-antitoxin module